MTAWEALAKFFHNGWTVAEYIRTYEDAKARNAGIWPPYSQLREVKKLCVPPRTKALDDEFICPMQSYLDHQTYWLLDDPFLLERIKEFARDPLVTFKLIVNIGADGSGGHTVYRWGTHCTSLFATTIVPVQLQAIKGSDKAVLWSNPWVNSPTGHSYLRLKFEKELKGTYFSININEATFAVSNFDFTRKNSRIFLAPNKCKNHCVFAVSNFDFTEKKF